MKATRTTTATASSLTVWQAAKEAAVPVGAYWLCALFAYAAFTAAVLLSNGIDGGGIVLLVGLAATTFMGIALGQLLAFVRVRTWIVLAFGMLCWGASFAVAALGLAGLGDVAAVVAVALWLLPIALTGGLWSLETHRALWSIWLPLLYTTAAILTWSEARGTVANWFEGNKWAIWDIVTIAVLGCAVLLILVYLVARETHRLALWRRGPRAPLAPSVVEKGAARPRLTILSVVLLLGMATALTLATALLSPYLWRTGEPEEEGTVQPAEPNEDPASEPTPPNPWLERLAKAIQPLAEQAVEAGGKAGAAVCTVLTLALLALLGALLAWRPLKRLVWIRHLKDPFWEVPSTKRIEQGWRLVEIALGDAGVFPRAGEDAAGLARRALPVLQTLSPVEVHGLEDAAEVADRVRFGLGVGAGDLEVMARFSSWAIDTVWERLGDREQVRCMYRGL